jgi:hypothetical protein
MQRSLPALRLIVLLVSPPAFLAALPYLVRAENPDVALQIRDETLIGALVNTALGMTAETDDLARADACRRLVLVMADDLRKSVKNGQLDRATALAGQIGRLLSDGVEANLRSAQAAAKASGRQAEIDRIAVEATQLCDQLTHLADEPPGSQSPELRRALDGVHRARVAIEQALVPR